MLWRIKQLFPLTYRSHYGEVQDNGTVIPRFAIWKMWFGKCYKVETV